MARRYEPDPLESPRDTLNSIAIQLPEALRNSLVGPPPASVFGMVIANHVTQVEKDLALCQQQQAERWEELRDLKQRNRLLAALLLHSFDEHQLSWEPGALEATLDGVKDRDLLLRRDPASGVLHLRAAPKGDPEPWERL